MKPTKQLLEFCKWVQTRFDVMDDPFQPRITQIKAENDIKNKVKEILKTK